MPANLGQAASFVITVSLAIPAAGVAEDPFDGQIGHAAEFAHQQLWRSTLAVPVTAYPQTTNASGNWNTTSASAWTSGFFPGTLWLAHQQSADRGWMVKALAWQAGVESQKSNTSTHDVGFMIFNSFGNAYRLTGNETYREVVLEAAASLATRYSAVVGCVRSWNTSSNEFRVIVDNLMNLELLFWASKHGGSSAWYDMAVSHALKTGANHVRPDGSTYHVVDYDPATGAVLRQFTRQGYSDESTWSRGQAWAIHGFTMAHRETRDPRFLDTARRTAEWFIAHLPADRVPYWDFDAPGIPDEPRDSSAAAIAASGLLELADQETDPSRAAQYLAVAREILASLSSNAYLAEGSTNRAVLLHGTQNKPEEKFDTGLVWGDHYFLQALLRYRRVESAAPPLPVLSARASVDSQNVDKTLDGQYESFWRAEGEGEWIEYDLGSPQSVARVSLAFLDGDQRSSRFEIQTSGDGAVWRTEAAPLTSGETNGKETFDIADRTVRFVRIVGHGNSRDASTAVTEAVIHAGDGLPDVTPPLLPAAWPEPGTYPPLQSLTLASEPGARIHYTTDGSAPDAGSPLYEGPLTVDRTQTIKALAVDEAGNRSAVASFTYIVQAYRLKYSTSAKRSSPVDLEGASVTGKVYIFILPDTGITRTDFYLDGSFRSTDTSAPWDFAGGTATTANPLNTKSLSRGSHTLKAVLIISGGSQESITATFTTR